MTNKSLSNINGENFGITKSEIKLPNEMLDLSSKKTYKMSQNSLQ